MPTPDDCLICEASAQPTAAGVTPTSFRTTCIRCGEFDCDEIAQLQVFGARHPGWVSLSAFVREQNAAGLIPLLTTELVRSVAARPIPRLHDRAMRLLSKISRDLGYDTLGIYSFQDDPSMFAISYSDELDELRVLFQILESEGFIEPIRSFGDVGGRLTWAGCVAAEELAGPRSASAQGFVAMWFDASMNEAYTEGFDRGIRDAGYQPLRIDNKEHAESISDAILSEIRRSRFVVADYTGANNGVYFEAGFAMGLGIPVIPTCRADHMSKLHFDVRHINTLGWDTPEDLAVKLARRLSAILGDGPVPRAA